MPYSKRESITTYVWECGTCSFEGEPFTQKEIPGSMSASIPEEISKVIKAHLATHE